MTSNAVVLLSGGQDSTTCLFWARKYYKHVHTVSFDYGQRHREELQAAKQIAELAGVPHEVITINGLRGGALTEHGESIATSGGFSNLPTTFLPARNLVFLCLALSVAARFEPIAHVVTGVCETDYSGYPDCRQTTMNHLEQAMTYGLGLEETATPVRIITPLMFKSKMETVLMARDLPGCWEALRLSVTCYEGRRPGCGTCPACVLRARGFELAALSDPCTT